VGERAAKNRGIMLRSGKWPNSKSSTHTRVYTARDLSKNYSSKESRNQTGIESWKAFVQTKRNFHRATTEWFEASPDAFCTNPLYGRSCENNQRPRSWERRRPRLPASRATHIGCNRSLARSLRQLTWLSSTRAGEDACAPRTEVSDYFHSFCG